MRKLGPALAAGIAFAAAYGCEDPPPQESMMVVNRPAISADLPVSPEASMLPCEMVGADVQRNVEMALRAQGQDHAYLRALDEGARAQAECFDQEKEQMRADCDRVGEHTRWEMHNIGMDTGIHPSPNAVHRAIREAQEACLAEYGLTSLEEEAAEETPASRSDLPVGKIW